MDNITPQNLSLAHLSQKHLSLSRPLNEAQLDEALPYIMSAPKDNAPILHLCYRPDVSERCFTDELQLSCDKGVIGDRWLKEVNNGGKYSGDKRVHVCILPKRILELVWREDDDTIYTGDNMIVDMDLSYQNIPIGSHIKIGTALLKVSDVYNGGCKKWMARYGEESFRWFNRTDNRTKRLRGMLCEIITDGVVKKGDLLCKIL